jgi:hypothetical protein
LIKEYYLDHLTYRLWFFDVTIGLDGYAIEFLMESSYLMRQDDLIDLENYIIRQVILYSMTSNFE